MAKTKATDGTILSKEPGFRRKMLQSVRLLRGRIGSYTENRRGAPVNRSPVREESEGTGTDDREAMPDV